METMIPVREIMTREAVTVDVNLGVPEAAKKMVKHGVGSVIVTEGGRPVGIVTEKDLTKKIISKNIKPSSVSLKELMTTPLITIPAMEDVRSAMQKMLKMRVRRLPVVEKGKLVGIITDTDLIAISAEMGEIFADLIEMHRERVPPSPQVVSQGICENCGEISDNLIARDGMLLCESCRETE